MLYGLNVRVVSKSPSPDYSTGSQCVFVYKEAVKMMCRHHNVPPSGTFIKAVQNGACTLTISDFPV